MNIDINSEKFLEIKNITSILNKDIKLVGYKDNNGIVSIDLEVYIDYLTSICDDTFSYDKKFSIEISCNDFNDVILNNYEISIVEGLGIEISFMLKFDVINKVEAINDELDNKLKEALKDRCDNFLDDDRKCPDLNEEIENDIKNINDFENQENDEDVAPIPVIIEENNEEIEEVKIDESTSIFPKFMERNTKIRLIYVDNMNINDISAKYNISLKKIYSDNNYEIKDYIIIKDE